MTGRRRRDRTVGQALVEFSLTLPIFLLVLLGVIEGGRLVTVSNMMSQAAREAARAATVQAAFVGATGAACSAPTCPATVTALRSNVLAAANGSTMLVGPIPTTGLYLTCTSLGAAPTGDWTSGNDCASVNAPGNVVSVRVVVAISSLTPIFAEFMPDSVTGSATMAIP